MSHVPHELNHEFPQFAPLITALRQSDSHFARMSNTYHDLNRDVHRAETDVEPTSDAHLTEMRKARMTLKDEIYSYLKARAETT